MPKLVIEIDTENGYTQFFKRRDVLVKVMGEVERILRKKDPDTAKVAVKGGGISAYWKKEETRGDAGDLGPGAGLPVETIATFDQPVGETATFERPVTPVKKRA